MAATKRVFQEDAITAMRCRSYSRPCTERFAINGVNLAPQRQLAEMGTSSEANYGD